MVKTAYGSRSAFALWRRPAAAARFHSPGRTNDRKYFETVRDLRSRGFAVAILDGRGRGCRSARSATAGRVRNFAHSSTSKVMCEVVLPDCPPPYFALAHSMGATIMIRAVARGQRWFDRVVSRRRCWGSLSCSRRDLPAPCCGSCASAASAECTFRAAIRARSTCAPLPATFSPPIRCAMRATPRFWKQSPRSGLAGRPSPGATPPSAPCAP